MAICGCGLSVHCCQPAVAGGVIYADLRGELSTHLALEALFTQSSSCTQAADTSFPLSKHTGGGDTAPAFSGQCVCLQLTWEVGLPPLCGVFLPPPLSQAFLAPGPGCVPLLLPSPARPSLFIYSSGRDSPPPLFSTQGTPPSLLPVFIVLIAYYSVCLFPLGGAWSFQGAMLIWPRVVCGRTVYHLAHLVVHIFPSRLGAGVWRQPWGPPGFSF
jgi:hypothetical protein